MAQGTPNLTDCVPAGLRLLEHRPVTGGGGNRGEAYESLSGPQAKISRLWDFEEFDEAPQSEPVNVVGETPNRGSNQGGAAVGTLVVDARTGPTGVADDLTESDIGNLSAVLNHEVAWNTMKNYRVQWKNFIMWAVERGIRALPAAPAQVAAYLAERIEEYGHKPATLRGSGGSHSVRPQESRTGRSLRQPGGEEDAQKRGTQGWQAPEAGGGAHSRGIGLHTVNRMQPPARPWRQIRKSEERRVQGQPGHRVDQPDARRHAKGIRGCRPYLGRYSDRGRRDGTPSYPALQNGRRGRRCRCLPVRADDGGTQIDMQRKGHYGQCLRAAPQPDIATHQAGGADGGSWGRLQRSLAEGRHGAGPGEGWNRAASPDECGALAQSRNARSLHPQRDRRKGSGGAVPRLLSPGRMNGVSLDEIPDDSD